MHRYPTLRATRHPAEHRSVPGNRSRRRSLFSSRTAVRRVSATEEKRWGGGKEAGEMGRGKEASEETSRGDKEDNKGKEKKVFSGTVNYQFIIIMFKVDHNRTPFLFSPYKHFT